MAMDTYAKIAAIAFGLHWARRATHEWVPCRVVKGPRHAIHGKVPYEQKVVQWIGGEAVSSLEEMVEDGWEFLPLPQPARI